MNKKFLLYFFILCIEFFLIYQGYHFFTPTKEPKTYSQIRGELLNKKSEKVNIAIIDSGIEKSYLRNCADYVDFTKDEIKYDQTGHGTKMYEIIHSTKYGIAPYANISILKVTSSAGETDISNVVRAVKWCEKNDINIISFSMATSNDNKALHKELNNAHKSGIHIFSAVSNTSCYISYPAAYDEVIGIYSGNKQSFYDEQHYFFVSLDKYAIDETISGNSPATAFCAAAASYYLSNSNDKNKKISNDTLMHKIQGVLQE